MFLNYQLSSSPPPTPPSPTHSNPTELYCPQYIPLLSLTTPNMCRCGGSINGRKVFLPRMNDQESLLYSFPS